MTTDPRDELVKLMILKKSKVFQKSPKTFICGGAMGKGKHSFRKIFMDISEKAGIKEDQFILAENLDKKNKGHPRTFDNLADHENVIADVSSLVVVFLESAGAIAELGLFFGNKVLKKKLVIILNKKKFYKDKSFISEGILMPLIEKNKKSVLIHNLKYKKTKDKTTNIKIETEKPTKKTKDIIEGIVKDINNRNKKIEKRKGVKFDETNNGHIIFLIYQLIKLLQAPIIKEIQDQLDTTLEKKYSRSKIKKAIIILYQLNLIDVKKFKNQNFYYVLTDRENRISFSFSEAGKSSSPLATKIILREAEKEIKKFYENAPKSNATNRRRMRVIRSFSN